MQQKYSPVVRWLLYIVSFFSLLVGIIAGILLITQEDEESKQVGKNCLIAGVVGIVFWLACSLLVGCLSFFISLFLTLGATGTRHTLLLLLAV